ncbi:hypothetical protein Pmani_010289 [Petrolisthes manimaculis]|uniref:Uncharacterized protein n=1 Tax=Petrolisthes manimaculis TaxID=1843537 RepID=A0AAE1Q5B6_9EUCA|nr:hypothetical protein Pmani_010289 [Petrolisthes manimaculis]
MYSLTLSLGLVVTFSMAQQLMVWKSVWVSDWKLEQEGVFQARHTHMSGEIQCALLASSTPGCNLFHFDDASCSLYSLSVPSDLRDNISSLQCWTRGK